MNENEVVVGIDLGTTNSCIAIWDKYKVEVIQNDYGERTTPSIVHFFDENRYCVGLDAKVFLNQYSKSTIYSIKRVIGLNYNSEEVEKYKKDWPFNLIKQDRDKIGIEIDINQSKFTVNPETISCYILKKLKDDAEKFLKGKIITKAVVAVPYYFNTSQKEATMTAANMAGFEDVILINEPTAASMAFSFDRILEQEEKKLIIFDLGGGTFDVSLLTIEEGIIDVICVNGDTKLGGNDIDAKLCEYVEKKIREMERFRDLNNLDEIIKNQKEKIKSKCEFVKMNLTNENDSVLNLQNFYNKENISLKITRKELKGVCESFLSDIKKILDKLFQDAKEKKKSDSYNKSKIDYIILIGGATRMPLIIDCVEEYFGKKPITSFNPDETVAIGAALRGETLFNNSPYLDSLHLIDVIPLNIGVREGIDQKMEVILKRNTYIPCKKKNYLNP
jgi:molecular chaperone DnaK (HSP70)